MGFTLKEIKQILDVGDRGEKPGNLANPLRHIAWCRIQNRLAT
jgi:DNA-binding transcriptional MerR regulator